MDTNIIIKRFAAYLIDCLIVLIPIKIVAVICVAVTASALVVNLFQFLSLAALWYYFFFMETSAKFAYTTFGKKFLGVKTQTANGQPMEKKTAMIRALWKVISIESLTIFFRKEKKTFHDIQAKTDVVKA